MLYFLDPYGRLRIRFLAPPGIMRSSHSNVG